MYTPGNTVISQIFRYGTAGHLSEKAAAVFAGKRNLCSQLGKGKRCVIVGMDIVQQNLKPIEIQRIDGMLKVEQCPIGTDYFAESGTKQSADPKLIGKRLFCTDPVDLKKVSRTEASPMSGRTGTAASFGEVR